MADSEAAEGSYVELLKRMKHRLELAVFDEKTSPRDLAALTKRLSDVAKEINQLEDAEKEPLDDLDGSADGEFDAENI
ncbi:MAG: hypothetical protein ABF747_02335 [Bifidobacterium sp.]|uniref:Terminase small subunit n=1 Tax=Bifidobacterium fermentum TaxID=3059035 RepID=A0AB39UGX5_9BIFI